MWEQRRPDHKTQSVIGSKRMWAAIRTRFHGNIFPSSPNGDPACNPSPCTDQEIEGTTNEYQRGLSQWHFEEDSLYEATQRV